jgi:hypothetical protein
VNSKFFLIVQLVLQQPQQLVSLEHRGDCILGKLENASATYLDLCVPERARVILELRVSVRHDSSSS